MGNKTKKTEYGQFKTGLRYARMGKGEKILFLLMGGPGNDIPRGLGLTLYTNSFKPIAEQYTIYILTRKSDLPADHTTENMTDDYAELINDEFEGKIYGIMGLSYGGMILQHFAGKYENLAEKIIILSAAHKVNESGGKIDKKFAEYSSQGKNSKAYAMFSEALYPPGFKRSFMKVLMRMMGLFLGKHDNPHYKNDVLIEAEAELNHDPIENLKKIKKKILIICGDRDLYFPIEYFNEMHQMIPTSTLFIMHDKGHEAFMDKKAIQKILSWLEDEIL